MTTHLPHRSAAVRCAAVSGLMLATLTSMVGCASTASPSVRAGTSNRSGFAVSEAAPTAAVSPVETSAPDADTERDADSAAAPYPGIPRTGNVPAEDLAPAITDAIDVAVRALALYEVSSYRDADPGAWVQRTKPYLAPALVRRLVNGSRGDAGAGWDEFRAAGTEQAVRVDEVTLSDWYDHNAATMTLIATVAKSTRLNGQSWGHGPATTRFVTMRLSKTGRWQVADVRSTGDRS